MTQKNSTITNVSDGFEGFETLTQIVSQYMNAAENSQEALVEGAKSLVNDLRKLTNQCLK